MRKAWIGVGLTYVGAVVGAGFASGQEIWQFFSRHGESGTMGLLLSTVIFFLFGYLALEKGRTGTVQTFSDLLTSVYPPSLYRISDTMVSLFLFLGLGVVATGGGAALTQMTGLPVVLGALATTFAILAVVYVGTSMVIRANMILIPYLVVLMTATALFTWSRPVRGIPATHGSSWALSAFLYVSYNILTGIVVLIGVAKMLPARRDSIKAAALGAGILAALGLALHRVLMTESSVGDLPMVRVAHSIHPVMGFGYGITLWIALFTTGVGEAFALVQRHNRSVFRVLWIPAVMAFWSFQGLIATLYPVMGLLAIVLWIPLLITKKAR